MRQHHTRRKRRQAKMKIRSGGKFKVNHKSRSGRTGSVQSKLTPGALDEHFRVYCDGNIRADLPIMTHMKVVGEPDGR